MHKCILVDCDGVLSNFVRAFQKGANEITGLNRTEEENIDWDFLTLYPKDRHQEILEPIGKIGWCAGLEPYPGARRGVDELRKIGKVYCVTAPWHSSTWCWERTEWLISHMGFDKNDVLHIHDKWLVQGLTLIDDKPETLVKWCEATGNIGILWDQPYNRLFKTGTNIWRAASWENVIYHVKAITERRAT